MRCPTVIPRVVFVLLAWIGPACSTVPMTFHPSDPIPPDRVTHRLLDDVLERAVSQGHVNYPEIRRDAKFEEYLAQLNHIDPTSLPFPNGQLAFWINAYNAFAIQGILDGLTPAPYLGWYRYFKSREYGVGGQRLTLSDLEHEILRGRFREPRIHFAIVCASASCPALPSSAYHSEDLDRQLDLAAQRFINDSSRNRFDRSNKVARLSKIFDWFEEDFTAAAGSVQKYVSRYVNDPELGQEISNVPYRIEYLGYDWSLNGIAP